MNSVILLVFQKSKEIIEQFTNSGFAVYTYDQIGFGTRIEEGTLFYDRFAKWSKLGRMVADVRWAIDELSAIEFLDKIKLWSLDTRLEEL